MVDTKYLIFQKPRYVGNDCAVLWGILSFVLGGAFNTVEAYQHSVVYHQYCSERPSVHWRVFSTVGDTINTVERYHSTLQRIFSTLEEGYHKHSGRMISPHC